MQWRYLPGLMLVMALLLFKPSSAFAQTTITFDDITMTDCSSGTQIPNGYGGLNWSNFYAVNNSQCYSLFGPNGYTNGTVSTPNVAYNFSGSPASFSDSNFTFNSAYFPGAWDNALTIFVTGYEGGSQVDSTSFVVNTSVPTLA